MLKSRINGIDSVPPISNSYDVSDDIERYLKSYPSTPKEKVTPEYIRNWWNLEKHEFPRMALVARDYLCIPLSEVDIERLFSMGKNVIGVKRYSMTDSTLHALMMLKCHTCKNDIDDS